MLLLIIAIAVYAVSKPLPMTVLADALGRLSSSCARNFR
jgi:hypothetical protein